MQLRWVIGDGRRVQFWKDKWLCDSPLEDRTVIALTDAEKELTARDLWREGEGWDLQRISPHIDMNTRLRLSAFVLDSFTGAKDRLSWSGEADGTFSVRSAYKMLTRDEDPRPCMERMYNRVWTVVAPERVRTFLWLLTHQAIMTNEERHRRHICTTSTCQVCKGGVEDTMHIIRDCPAISGVWLRLIPNRWLHGFFGKTLLECVFWNLGEHGVVDGSPWSTKFAMTVWWSWKWRCGNIFGSNGKCRDRVRFLKDLATEVATVTKRERATGSRVLREERLISWSPPADGWLKLNTDGASRGNPGLAAAGGILRDATGTWRDGFALNIGICSAPLAELWGVYYGLYIAWEHRIQRLELEVDSEIVVGFLTTGINDSHPLSFLVRLCHDFISRDWIVRISHVYREANRLADGLANYAFSLSLGFHRFSSRLALLDSILFEDANGSARPRNVRV